MGSWPNPNPNRPTGRELYERLSTINFVHDNGRSLYIVDWRMVVVEGKVLHHVKREGELSGRGNVRIPSNGRPVRSSIMCVFLQRHLGRVAPCRADGPRCGVCPVGLEAD